ncbi:MAG: DinB family protein [Dehalococcoidia bacterium]|nr:DinB family protein [Dehalococcoidia bacterium]
MPVSNDPEMARIRGYLQAQAAKLSHVELAEKVRADMEQLRAAIEGVGDAAFGAIPAPDEWSPNEICAHLAYTSGNIAAGIRSVIDGGGQPEGIRDQMSATVVRHTGPEWWERMLREREELLAYVRTARGDEHLDVTWDHPMFGDLNWREWLLFLRIHDLDHARQLQAITAG